MVLKNGSLFKVVFCSIFLSNLIGSSLGIPKKTGIESLASRGSPHRRVRSRTHRGRNQDTCLPSVGVGNATTPKVNLVDTGNTTSFSNDSTSSSPIAQGSSSPIQNITTPLDLNSSSLVTASSPNISADPQSPNTSYDSNVTTQPSSTSASSGSQSDLLSVFSPSALKHGELFLGFLPDDGASGGNRQTMAQLNAAVGAKAAMYGWYAQAHSGTKFDGSQLLAVIDDVKACNCVFQPAVMPVGGWAGLTPDDNSQAVAIYQTDGTYQGTSADFKKGWATVAAAIKQIAPDVKMWWSPNVASAESYAQYEPDDMNTVDLVGIDFYPKSLSGHDFLDNIKVFHDKYAVGGRKLALGETGLGWAGSDDDKQKWLKEICAAKPSLPEFVGMAWFNYDKEYDYKIVGESSLNQKFTAFMQAS